LVDTPASGAGDRKVVEVRVFFWAPIQIQGHDLEFHKNPRKRFFAFLAFEAIAALCGEGACSRWAAKRPPSFFQSNLIARFCDCSAAEREQAPSPQKSAPGPLANPHPPCKTHLRNNIVYHCFKFLQCDSEEPCE
ncbi:hypothetical protein ACCC96_24320, partial [Pseudomonas sp. Pseusp11]